MKTKISLFLFLLVSVGLNCENLVNQSFNQTITTLIFDESSQPVFVGGFITNYSPTQITEKGVLYGLTNNLTIENSTKVDDGNSILQTAGWRTPTTNNGRINCNSFGVEQFNVKITHLVSSQIYYIRAYAINSSGGVIYGEVKSVPAKNYNRSTSSYDFANVWYAFSNSLFDLVSDEYINPNTVGFYYSTNENPTLCRYQLGASYNTCYKFNSQYNYLVWYDSWYYLADKTKRINNPLITFDGNKLNMTCSNAGVTIYYTLDGTVPTTSSLIYTVPIFITSQCTVKAIAVKSDLHDSGIGFYKIYNDMINVSTGLNNYLDLNKKDNILVYSKDLKIIINGVGAGEPLFVFNENGILINRINATGKTIQISVPSKGIYFVKIKEHTNKVLIYN